MERYRPQVVATYDANGFYGHPDHIQAHRITMAAVASTGIPSKVYFPTIARSGRELFAQRLREAGLEAPWGEDGPPAEWGSADEDISAWLDVTAYAGAKFDALAAHASQSENIFFLRMGRDIFSELMGREAFIRAFDTTEAPLPEDDLFAGLR